MIVLIIKTGDPAYFARWLRTGMRFRGWDLYDMSIESGVSDRTLADYLRGNRLPKLENLLLICKAFGKQLIIEDEKP